MKTKPFFNRPQTRGLLWLAGICCLWPAMVSDVLAQGRGGGGTGRGGNTSGAINTRVVAVADEQSNSLVVAVPDTMLPMIEELVEKLDQPVTDITELRVFRLKNANPQEMVDLLANLFPDETRNNSNQQQTRFGGFFGARGGRGNNNAAATPSDRAKKQGRVLAVADPRTSSLIVSAASELMPQIVAMVQDLDSSAARKQNVFVYSLENADPQETAAILQEMFQRTTTTSANRNNANQSSALSSRIQSNNQQISTGQAQNSGFGAAGGNRGGGGGQTFR